MKRKSGVWIWAWTVGAVLTICAVRAEARQGYSGQVYDCVPEGSGWLACKGEEGQDIDCRQVGASSFFCVLHQSFPA